MAGTRIGSIVIGPDEKEYELTEFLGAGAFGEVYRAENKESDTIIAAKLLPMGGVSDSEFKQALLNEASLATQVFHPNVVKVIYVGDNAQVGPFVLMEYISGQTLEEFLQTQNEAGSKLSLGKATEIMLQIAQGGRAINEKLVHRDIKPNNIMVSGNRLKITDFGLSKIVTERTRTLTFKGIGPIRYMAPEAWQLQKNTPKMDIYSAGLVFYEILSLQHPLQSRVTDPSHIEAWRKAHLFEPIGDIRSSRDDIPRSLSQLLSRMVAKRSADRPEWDEIISILSSEAVDSENSEELTIVMDKAIAKKDALERSRLEEEQKRTEKQEVERLYQVVFKQLISKWDTIVESFNIEFQGGEIKKSLSSSSRVTYQLPNAPHILVSLFSRQETDIKIASGNLIGGGFIGIENGAGANILLLKESSEDLYGKWVACAMKISALVDPRKSLSRLSMPPKFEPFGFQAESDFYEHIRYASGGMHIFTYELKSDLDQLFRELLETAFAM